MKRMHIVYLAVVICLIFGGLLVAQTKDDIDLYKDCKYCGMNRGIFDFSRMMIVYEDGTSSALCSVHCAAVDLANNIDKSPQAIKVADFNGKQLIDAEKAFWAVGGNKSGVMSKRGKWAFEKKDDAETFMKANQGKTASFDEVMKMAYEDMYEDAKMIREKRKMKRMKMMEQKS
jgi:copper chaperone NosL